jgi:hypothetical protein
MPTTSKTATSKTAESRATAARVEADQQDDRSTEEKAQDEVDAFTSDQQGADSPLLKDDDDDSVDDTAVDQHGDRVSLSATVSEPIRMPFVTYTDNRGVERLAGGFDDGWEPAQVDPDPKLVARNEARLEHLEEAGKKREERQEALKTESEKGSSGSGKSSGGNSDKAS